MEASESEWRTIGHGNGNDFDYVLEKNFVEWLVRWTELEKEAENDVSLMRY